MEFLNRQCVDGKVKPELQWKPRLLEPPGHENTRPLLWKVAGSNWNQPWRGAMYAVMAGLPNLLEPTWLHQWPRMLNIQLQGVVLFLPGFGLPLVQSSLAILPFHHFRWEFFYSVFSIASCSLVLYFRRVHCQRWSLWISEGLGNLKQCWTIKL